MGAGGQPQIHAQTYVTMIDRWCDWYELAGLGPGITIDAQTGMWYGGSDPRSDEAAVGY